jgi:hypothetical protein
MKYGMLQVSPTTAERIAVTVAAVCALNIGKTLTGGTPSGVLAFCGLGFTAQHLPRSFALVRDFKSRLDPDCYVTFVLNEVNIRHRRWKIKEC